MLKTEKKYKIKSAHDVAEQEIASQDGSTSAHREVLNKDLNGETTGPLLQMCQRTVYNKVIKITGKGEKLTRLF